MERNIHNIELEIPNSGIFIMGLENENLIISLDLAKFECKKKLNAGELAKPLHPYIIYEVLEKNNKNNFNDVKIIDKIEDENNIIYYFNFRLILKENEDNKNKEALKTLSFMQNFIPAYFFSYQIIGDSKAIPKNVLEYLKNRYGYEGKNYKSIFKKEVYINCNCFERLNFSHCEFESKVSLRFLKDNKYKEFHNGVDFSNCIFKNEVDFSYFASGTPLPDNKYYNNAQNTLFKDCIFENKVDFHNSKITNNIYFNNAHFKDYVDFHECEFNKIACFYGVRFDKAPNFSQAIFKDNFNALNITLNFYFDDLKIQISKEYENFNKDIKEKENKKPLDKFANDFRDSFRIFKSALIKDNNLLDTSNFHKYELYCKEIELKNKKGKTFKDVVDRWQLIFYRKLCDHHTDILQSLNSLILVIGIFVISSVATVVGFNYSLGYKPILEHWYFSLDFYNHHINSIIQDNYLFVATVNLVMLFGYLILVGFALCLKYMREFFIIISYVITLLVLAVSPKILIPAMGIFTDKRAILDPLSVLGGIYTIIFGFVAFSFIKTIRKNSIVPS
ncbi:TPA: pentapeptide repeat-containing protein [Campylobacter jejuni]|uniref:pentapeptide repeat-containing protein n=1 Tax=Campylobacter jejuni TaxID=197 RepID=UPI0009AA31EC|nr:pentapeptide repeat-containing protein [Campylobacter jejuni]EAI4704438.1 pentapeptide repeat-containing protein [Campylobacter jejuni]EAI8902033.1 pentapeptide repeat-containing protein [Campylobacter jejuni]EAJ8750488.1 pentapeptide repeat-containing protein [Campylobacter jejuni]EAK0293234.1 pentapeptide repeat-containing protein [Campylobacter jejuni]EAK2042689.1 pentapeptide repeat-containing protein [Campylobacter jejuni]